MRESKARRRIREALRRHGYEPGKIQWSTPYGFGEFSEHSTGGFSVDNFGAFYSAEEFVRWLDENPKLHIACIAECRDDAYDDDDDPLDLTPAPGASHG